MLRLVVLVPASILLVLLIWCCAGSRPSMPPDADGKVSVTDGGVTPGIDQKTSNSDITISLKDYVVTVPDTGKPPPKPDKAVPCGPGACDGCCTASGTCVFGSSDTACGQSGDPCVSCAAKGVSCINRSCCQPSCSGKPCGSSDGCGGTCKAGSGCCSPSCSGKACGDPDGCGGTCSGPCPGGWATCTSSHTCKCPSPPHFKVVSGVCLPSCGKFLAKKGLPDYQGGCCKSGCTSGTFAGGPGDTHDCTYCCAGTKPGSTSCK